ncbi:hypothetical protein TorRG33x02_102200 [Trema orientale]|uniref:Uncharacterized protein n=1 Tax=Trema orientale TaxID=63057 RepID=A0A2P5F7P6_TREOI|nr:hypothetical protein TorRG33x02_102200 [Trema orientale]
MSSTSGWTSRVAARLLSIRFEVRYRCHPTEANVELAKRPLNLYSFGSIARTVCKLKSSSSLSTGHCLLSSLSSRLQKFTGTRARPRGTRPKGNSMWSRCTKKPSVVKVRNRKVRKPGLPPEDKTPYEGPQRIRGKLPQGDPPVDKMGLKKGKRGKRSPTTKNLWYEAIHPSGGAFRRFPSYMTLICIPDNMMKSLQFLLRVLRVTVLTTSSTPNSLSESAKKASLTSWPETSGPSSPFSFAPEDEDEVYETVDS